MPPLLSLIATLALLGAAFTLLHWIILWLGLSDLPALLLFALPVAFYIAWCSFESRSRMLRFAAQIYLSFGAVVLASAGIVYFIG